MADVKMAFMQLSSCWGCHQSLLNAHVKLIPLLPTFDVVYWPAVVDFKLDSLKERPDKSIHVGFLEGGVRTAADKELVELMRKKCVILIAFGACANHGSVIGMANLYKKEDLLKRKFVEAESIVESEVEGSWPNDVPEILDRLYTVPQITNVEAKLPGCPPTTGNIVAALLYVMSLLTGKSEAVKADKNVCMQCSLNAGGCLLDANELCFGSVTAGGCTVMCPTSGEGPCTGCFQTSSNPEVKRAEQLFNLVAEKYVLKKEDVKRTQKFIELYLGLGNFDFMYFEGDPLQKLAEKPESFEEKVIKTKKGEMTVLAFTGIGNELIDNTMSLLVTKLRGNEHFKFSQASVCSHCDRKIVDKTYTEVKRDFEGLPNKEKCFLEEGYICMGPVTKAGCGTVCPNNANAPCLGCYGAPENIKDQGAKMLATYASLAKMDPKELEEKVLDPAGLFNRFTLAASTFGGRVEDTREE